MSTFVLMALCLVQIRPEMFEVLSNSTQADVSTGQGLAVDQSISLSLPFSVVMHG
jgi:hypothetical protein